MISKLRSRLPRRVRTRRAPSPSPSTATAGTVAVPPLSARRQLVRAGAVVVLILSFSFLLQLLFVSRLQYSASQQARFDAFRSALANGTVPIGPADRDDVELAAGTPIALLEIPAIDVADVVVEGTRAADLFGGPGHRRDTPLPGQVGVSALFGRRSTYGGPFSRLEELGPGAEITVTTGQGTFEFEVDGVRREGDPVPAGRSDGSSWLELATADGSALIPDGVVRVDARLIGDAVGGAARVLSAVELPPEERVMAGDARTLWAFALWLQALIGVAVLAVWSWHRWGRPQTWIVFIPPMLLVGLATSGEAAQLLPNLS